MAWTVLGVYFLIALAVGLLRVVVMPHVDQYREQVAHQLERAIGARVTLGTLGADWSGYNPRLSIDDFKLYDEQGAVALELPRIVATISTGHSLLAGELRFDSIIIAGPALAIRRDPTGHVFIAGVKIKRDENAPPGFDEWLLRQDEVVISAGRVDWQDEMRAAPRLVLENVGFHLTNSLTGRHAFALAATPPAWLASPIDVRGQFDGKLFGEMDHVNGKLYARFDYMDLAGWAPWVDYPVAVRTGRGGLIVWLTLQESRVTQAIADVSLGEVRMQLSKELPELAFAELQGRVTALETAAGPKFLSLFRRASAGYRVSAEDVTLHMMSGPEAEHMRFAVEWSNRPDLTMANGTAEVNTLDIETLAALAGAIPLPAEGRQFLATMAPHGTIRGIKGSWAGGIDSPDRYSFSAEFEDLGMRPVGRVPGFDHLSGSVQLHETDGRLSAVGRQVELVVPTLFLEGGRQKWDALGFDLEWTTAGKGPERSTELRLARADLRNADVAADAKGSWRSLRDSPGYVDFEATVARADGKALYRYIPNLDEATGAWMQGAILAGDCGRGVIRVQGDLAKFPFERPGSGTFAVSTQVSNGTLRYDPHWPVIDRIAGTLTVKPYQLSFTALEGSSSGARLLETTARVDRLGLPAPTLEVIGKAEGATTDFFNLLDNSPLRASVGAATGGIKAEGRGRLDLKLTMPIARPSEFQLSGGYQLTDNRWLFSGGLFPLTQLNGRLEFTEKKLTARATAQLFGGPTSLTVASRGTDSVSIAAQGTASLPAVEQAFPFPYADRIEGQAPYHANVLLGPRSLEIVLESNLQGVTVDLPAPLAKARDDALPFRLQRDIIESENLAQARNSLVVTADHLLNMTARFQSDSSGTRLERAAIGLGDAAAPLPERSAIAVSAAFDTVDVDRLVPVLARSARDGTGGQAMPPLSFISLRTPEMIVFGRRFSSVSVRAEPKPDAWGINIESDQASGDVAWKPEGRGSVGGHFSQLSLPEPVPGSAAVRNTRELPALDITGDRFALGRRELGRLVLVAATQDGNWQISNLSLSGTDGAIHAEGLWKETAGLDHTDVQFSIESSDSGKYLASMGYPGAVRGAKATLKGHLSWNGPPHAVDYPSLAGTVSLHAEKGQFLKVDPGAGRLLGVLSLQSLPRRITLDFRDVFSEGFGFDAIDASGAIDRGILTTQDFRMTGPAAAVSLTGTLDLDRETQNLRVRIVPSVGDNVAVATGLALLNPIVGLGTLVAGRLFKDPLGKLFAYEYDVTGSWSDPKVTKAGEKVLQTKEDGAPAQSPQAPAR